MFQYGSVRLLWVVVAMLAASWILIFIGLFDDPPRGNSFYLRPYVFSIGAVIGAFGGVLVTFIAFHKEMGRFERQLKERPFNKPVRMPLRARAITMDEFKRMWGDDPIPR